MSAFNIRQATHGDLPFLLDLEGDAFPEYQRASRQSLSHSIQSPFQELIIAELPPEGAVAAMNLFKYKQSLRIYSIAVRPSKQGSGLGLAMLEYAKELANRQGFAQIILEASAEDAKLVGWYEKHGFSKTSLLKDYYAEGRNAYKMEYKTNAISQSKKMNNLIVVNQPFDWGSSDLNAKVISVKEYINDPVYQNSTDFRVFNLCNSYSYQTHGYYVSLLASARGQRVIPSITTVRDVRMLNVIQSVAYEVDELINELLEKQEGSSFSLNIYFGQAASKKYRRLASKLYQLFEAPLFKVFFVKNEKWLIKEVKILSLKNIPEEDRSGLLEFASKYFSKKRHNYPKLTNYKYDLAILVNPREENPPSNEAALQLLKKAGHQKGVYVEFITKKEMEKLNEFDALFIRETTNVNHYTYEFSRLAYAEGLVVMDDPWSILRCSNKIYQHELFRKHKIKTPQTTVFSKSFFEPKQLELLSYPLVLKQPDSAFSLGVIKVKSKEEAQQELLRLFKKSDMVIGQEFVYSEFDWRIGILDNQPLFACKYYMSKGHWQIYNWNSDSGESEGDSETLPISEVPEPILKTALKAAGLIGDGLYGVDLKLVNGQAYVVEVNDNPNIDQGVEDLVLKEGLYDRIIDSFVNRIELAKNIRRINFGG